MGERSNPDPESINNRTPPAMDIKAIVRAATAQLSQTFDKRFQQLAALLEPHDAAAESDTQQHQQVGAEVSEAANLACRQVFQCHGFPALSAADPHNIPEVGSLETSTPNGPCRPTIKLNDIGTYNGSHRWAELNTGWLIWESLLCNAFQPDTSKIRHLAGERKWEWLRESIASYFYAKLSLLRAVFPTHQETDLLNEICYGLPVSLQLNVHTHLLSNPNMDDLLTKLHNLEGPCKATLRSGSRYNSRNDPVPPPLTSSTTYSAPTQLISSAADIP
ncbi:uncharacterized protein UHOD_11640 [Ustilago sp. UG-2017b]|nr:uncharacterized protein UHOD_11640 [Ustilago sp. UG-2017b]